MEERSVLADVKIVGMRFYPGSAEYLYNASQNRYTEEKCLYLVAEVANAHDSKAVMLHNGKKKLGNVSREQAPRIREFMERWNQIGKGPFVVVCDMTALNSLHAAKFTDTMCVRGTARINERLARKFSDKHRRD